MLRFFRQIRQRLITDNKFSKYLLYAIGEILLVVIGILIALQVDTWNEERVAANETKLLFEEVNKQLVQNIKDMDRVINGHISQDTLFFKVLTRKVGYEDYKKSPIYYSFWGDQETVDLVDDDFKTLLAKKGELTEFQDSLLSDLKFLNDEPKARVDYGDESIEDLHTDLGRLLKKQPGFSDFIVRQILTDEMIKFCLTDPRYINELADLLREKVFHINSILYYRILALNVYEKIAEMLKIEKDTSLIKDFSGLDPLKGVYELNDNSSGVVRAEIRGIYKLKANIYVNGSLVEEHEVHPYSDRQIIFYKSDTENAALFKIEYGDNREVLGLRPYFDFREKRWLLKKIE